MGAHRPRKTTAIGRIRIHPTNPDLAYVAALGDPYAPNCERGIFKTTDGGKTWTRSLLRDDKLDQEYEDADFGPDEQNVGRGNQERGRGIDGKADGRGRGALSVPERSSQDPLNYPIRLNNKLAALQNIVESGDNKPTSQSYAVFKELSGRLDRELARIDALVKNDVAALEQPAVEGRIEHVRDGVPAGDTK